MKSNILKIKKHSLFYHISSIGIGEKKKHKSNTTYTMLRECNLIEIHL